MAAVVPAAAVLAVFVPAAVVPAAAVPATVVPAAVVPAAVVPAVAVPTALVPAQERGIFLWDTSDSDPGATAEGAAVVWARAPLE